MKRDDLDDLPPARTCVRTVSDTLRGVAVPAEAFFRDQLDQLRAFMADPRQTVRVVAVDPDLKPVLVKMLAGFDRDPNTPHTLVPSDAAFRARPQFFADLLADAEASFRASLVELFGAGVYEHFAPADLGRQPPEQKLALYLSALAESLPDHVGAVVVLLDPAAVADPAAFRAALVWLAENTWSPWVKYLVIDDRLKPRAAAGEKHPRVGHQTFYLPPAEIEARAKRLALSSDDVPAADRRQAAAMMAGFALAHKDYATAGQAYRVQVEMAQADGGTPAEEAQARYGLGNTLLAAKDFPAAEGELNRALELAIAGGQPAFLALVLTQLGVAVRGQGRAEQAAECFRLARENARAAGVPPLEAFALDTVAQCHLGAGDRDAARQCWRDALAVYDGITSDTLADVRESGRRDVLPKLEALEQQPAARGKVA
jgi:tetratricopeptide (TPR) repeat protein